MEEAIELEVTTNIFNLYCVKVLLKNETVPFIKTQDDGPGRSGMDTDKNQSNTDCTDEIKLTI